MNREERIEAWKRELERMTLLLNWSSVKADTEPSRFALIARTIVFFLFWPYRYVRRKIALYRVKREVLRSIKQTRQAMAETARIAREMLEGLPDAPRKTRGQQLDAFFDDLEKVRRLYN